MTNLQDLASLDQEARERMAYLVVIDHPRGVDVFGTDSEGEPITHRFSSPGTLPWGTVFGLIVREGNLSYVEPGQEDTEPGTGFPRYIFKTN